MSRDRDASGAGNRDAERDAELVTAYVDGVSELAPEERRRVEARLAADPQARAEQASVRSLLDELRALPPEGDEPDWGAMERSIRDTVGDQVPRPWWRAWRWLVPAMSCVTAAAVLVLLFARTGQIHETVLTGERRPGDRPGDRPDDHPQAAATHPVDGDDDAARILPLWLNGAEVDVDLSAAEMLSAPGFGDDEQGPSDGDGDDGVALLPAADLAWVDRLDDAAIARAERWLASDARGSRDSSGSGGSGGGPARKKS